MPAQDSDNTHNLAAQASAARIITTLQADFFEGRLAELSSEEIAYLNQFLEWAKNGANAEDKPLPSSHPHIQGLVYFVEMVLASTKQPFCDPGRRITVFTEIQQQVNTPVDQWMLNRYYDERSDEKDKMISLCTPLSTALNLTCLGLFKKDIGYAALNQNTENDILARQLSLFNCLEDLSRSQKCSAGRQHDVLFLLNGVYPVKTIQGYQSILLIEDTQQFIYQCLSNAITHAIQHHERWACALTWLHYQAGHKEKPDLSWFSLIREQVIESIKHDLSEYCINPDTKETSQYIQAICNDLIELTVPDAIHPNVVLIKAILNCHNDNLDEPRNTALDALKQSIKVLRDFTSINTEAMQNFLEMEYWYQATKKYRTIRVVIGPDEVSFFQKTIPFFKKQIDTLFENRRFNRTAFTNGKQQYLKEFGVISPTFETITVRRFFFWSTMQIVIQR